MLSFYSAKMLTSKVAKNNHMSFTPFLVSIFLFSTMYSNLHLAIETDLSLFLNFNVELFLVLSLEIWIYDLVKSSDSVYQSTFLNFNANMMEKNLKFGFILFLLTELLVFAALFTVLHIYIKSSAYDFMPQLGFGWPPKGVLLFDVWGIPLFNTWLLFISGLYVTYTHHSLSLLFNIKNWSMEEPDYLSFWSYFFFKDNQPYKKMIFYLVSGNSGFFKFKVLLPASGMADVISEKNTLLYKAQSYSFSKRK